ncbi:MAG: succinate dehydrogenase, hydrophobic membrane anchor protein [Sphingomonadaceae bacterium]|jgi:succinate dehydrogenase / fumarate reductase membrane anchor subunit|nr:succinate dehydrogenase, hydrophobic membrane anchor protein [Sphingomonadaceae bacterium]
MGNGTGLGRVRGLGSAKHGGGHWVIHRMTAIGTLLLMLWLVFSLVRLPAYDFATVRLWLEQAIVAVPMMLLVISVFWHFRIGLQVLIEDYVHEEGLKFASLLGLTFYTFGMGALALFAIAKIALTGTPN